MSIRLDEPRNGASGSAGIAQALRTAILRGQLAPNEQLPPISQLAGRYRATPVTVRRALSALEAEGLVRVEHGVGTFVADWRHQLDPLQLRSFTEEMSARDLRAGTEVLGRQPRVTHATAARALRLEADARLASLARVRRVRGVPVAFQRSFVPPEMAQLVTHYSAARSLYEMLHELFGRVPLTADERISAVPLPEDVAEVLAQNPGAPGWLALRTTFDADGWPLMYDEAYFAADRIAMRVRRQGGQSVMELELSF